MKPETLPGPRQMLPATQPETKLMPPEMLPGLRQMPPGTKPKSLPMQPETLQGRMWTTRQMLQTRQMHRMSTQLRYGTSHFE